MRSAAENFGDTSNENVSTTPDIKTAEKKIRFTFYYVLKKM